MKIEVIYSGSGEVRRHYLVQFCSFINKETEAQRREATCQEPHSKLVATLRIEDLIP